MILPTLRALFLLLIFAPAAWAQVVIPDTPAGRNFSAMLNALNSRDRNVVADYVAKYGRGESVDSVMRTAEQVGTLKLVRIAKSDPLGLQFVLEMPRGLQVLGLLEVDDAEPARTKFSLPWTPILPGATVIGYDVDAATRSRVIETVASRLKQSYVFAETADTMAEALTQHRQKGDYDDVVNGWVFANRLTEDLQKISDDKHLVFSFSPVANGPPVRSPYSGDPRLANPADCGFERAETMSGGIAYLKINVFIDPNLCRSKASDALTSLTGAKALILDLRDAVGGHAGMGLFILSQLLAEPVRLSAVRSREPAGVQELRLDKPVPGISFTSTPVYVLTSSQTFSAAEWFAYDLQALKRATIVGEPTKGGAHTARPERIDERFAMNMPYADAVNPITGSNWEGTGVRPDVPAPAADALAVALKLAQKLR